jgi:hypothetical protein
MLDDATPTPIVIQRVERYRNPHIKLVTSNTAQHLGLLATDVCHAEPQFVSRFDLHIWGALERWMDSISKREDR